MTRECLANAIKTAFGPNYAHSPDDVMTGGGTRTLYYFTGTVDTDGTAMHLHFRRCARPGEKPPPTDDDDAEEKPKVETPSLPKLTAVPKVLLLADPGRVNMVTFTVMVDGDVIVESCGAKGHRMRPVKFGLTAKQYHTMIGTVRRRKIRERRLKQDPDAKQLDTDLSGTTLRTGDISKVLAYMEKSNMMAARRWDDALSTRASNGRRRSALARQRVLAKWLTRVHDKVVKLTGVKEATVVWGVKRVSARRCRLRQAAVAPTGRGNIPVPTHRIADVVKTIKGWTVVSGDEYRTSAASCLPAHTDAIAPRFRGKTEKVARKRAATFTGRVRGGYVVGMRHRRLIKRHDTYEAGALTDDALVRMCEGVPHHVQHEMKRVKMDEKTTWVESKALRLHTRKQREWASRSSSGTCPRSTIRRSSTRSMTCRATTCASTTTA